MRRLRCVDVANDETRDQESQGVVMMKTKCRAQAWFALRSVVIGFAAKPMRCKVVPSCDIGPKAFSPKFRAELSGYA